MKKRGLSLLASWFAASLFIILSMSLSSAENIVISFGDRDNGIFSPNEKIIFSVSVYNNFNELIDTQLNVTIEDASKTRVIQTSAQSNKPIDISLGENAPSGYWKITANYNNIQESTFFMVKSSERAKFELINDTLTITNIGNTRYSKTIQIIIGNSIGTKQLDLDIGEKVSFRLVAPTGIYNVKITDGETTISKGNVALTGKVIGILDEAPLSQTLITTNVPNNDDVLSEEKTNSDLFRNQTFVYVFIIVVIAGAILLAIERHYKKRAYLAAY